MWRMVPGINPRRSIVSDQVVMALIKTLVCARKCAINAHFQVSIDAPMSAAQKETQYMIDCIDTCIRGLPKDIVALVSKEYVNMPNS